ncbi:hypothetical protein [Bradyrhizobium macuxiense]|nr:hypothetical protein [Bradyrhizobium macuxiense]
MRGPRAPLAYPIAALALPGCMRRRAAPVGPGDIVFINQRWF